MVNFNLRKKQSHANYSTSAREFVATSTGCGTVKAAAITDCGAMGAEPIQKETGELKIHKSRGNILLFALLAFFFIGNNVVAQDIILKKDGTEIKAKIIELTEALENCPDGWRLPTKEELKKISDSQWEIGGFTIEAYWTNEAKKRITFDDSKVEKSKKKSKYGVCYVKTFEANVPFQENLNESSGYTEIALRGIKGGYKFYADGVQIATWDEMRNYFLSNEKALKSFDGAVDLMKRIRGTLIAGIVLTFVVPPVGLGLTIGASAMSFQAEQIIVTTVDYYNGNNNTLNK